jgi:hypothetical protein
MKTYSIILGSGALAVGLGLSGQASAVTVSRDYLSHGTASCQSSLPVFDGNIRKRPMAVANEGSTTAFVTCDTESINNAGTGFTAVGVFVKNRAGTAGLTVNCTLVNGVLSPSGSFPKTSPAIAVGGISQIAWTTADNSGANFAAPAVSCALPAGVDIWLVEFTYPEDVGM